jgi:phage baseplate assembly protein V
MNELQQQQASFKFGVVSAIDESGVKARVRFDDLDGLESMFLPIAVQKSFKDKSYWMLDVGEHVACLMDANAESGVILCAVYSEADLPPVTNKDKRHVRFDDGTTIEYDRAEHQLTIQCVGNIEIKATGNLSLTAARIDLN